MTILTTLPPAPSFTSPPHLQMHFYEAIPIPDREQMVAKFVNSSRCFKVPETLHISTNAPKRLGILAYLPTPAYEEKLIIWLFKRKAEEYQALKGEQERLKFPKTQLPVKSEQKPLDQSSDDRVVANLPVQTQINGVEAPEIILSSLPTLTLPTFEPIVTAQKCTSFSIPFLTSFSAPSTK